MSIIRLRLQFRVHRKRQSSVMVILERLKRGAEKKVMIVGQPEVWRVARQMRNVRCCLGRGSALEAPAALVCGAHVKICTALARLALALFPVSIPASRVPHVPLSTAPFPLALFAAMGWRESQRGLECRSSPLPASTGRFQSDRNLATLCPSRRSGVEMHSTNPISSAKSNLAVS